MALVAANVRQAITGAVYYDPTSEAPAPTGTDSDVTGYDDLGYISEDGVTLTLPGEGDTTSIRAWQNAAIVRTIRTPSEDQPTFELTFIETKLEVIEAVFGVTVDQGASEGSFVINTNVARSHARLVLDVVDGDELIRVFAPRAIVTGLDAISFTNADPIGYAVTITAEYDDELGGQARVWMTALATSAPATEPEPEPDAFAA